MQWMIWHMSVGVAVTGVSGSRFTGDPIRDLPPLRRSSLPPVKPWPTEHPLCDRWIVVTTIFQPSNAMRRLEEMTRRGWCFVIAGDANGPAALESSGGSGLNNVIYLDAEIQRGMHYKVLEHIPWRHFGRKNLGYLYAIEHGAKVIYDTDDDNWLKELVIPILEGSAPAKQPVRTGTGPLLVNPFAEFKPTCGDIWPRGFPLDSLLAHARTSQEMKNVTLEFPPSVTQFLADKDP